MSEEKHTKQPVWCVVANIKKEIPFGPGGVEKRIGTKHFSPGTKVYCFQALWGDGYQRVQVIGRHRGSHRYVTMIIKSDWLTNWRVKAEYSPSLAAKLKPHWDETPNSKRQAELIAHGMNGNTWPNPPWNEERWGCLPSILRSFLGL